MVDVSWQPGSPGRVALGALAAKVVGRSLAKMAGLAVGQGCVVHPGRFPSLPILNVAGRALQVAEAGVAGRLDLSVAG